MNNEDLRIETINQSTQGQHIQRQEQGVRITHIPTGITVEYREERSQIKNKEKCLEKLEYIVQAINEHEALKEKNEKLNKIIKNIETDKNCYDCIREQEQLDKESQQQLNEAVELLKRINDIVNGKNDGRLYKYMEDDIYIFLNNIKGEGGIEK